VNPPTGRQIRNRAERQVNNIGKTKLSACRSALLLLFVPLLLLFN